MGNWTRVCAYTWEGHVRAIGIVAACEMAVEAPSNGRSASSPGGPCVSSAPELASIFLDLFFKDF